MALVISTSAEGATNPNVITLLDSTGDYNASTNPGGWGAPNPDRSNITVNSLLVTKPNETSATTINVLASPYIFMFSYLQIYFTPAIYGGTVVGTQISAASNATPIVITTTTAHGRSTGDRVGIVNVEGNIAANGYWTITVLTTTTFSLDGSAGSGAYSGGGFVVYLSTATDFIDGVWKFQSNVTASAVVYTTTTYYLHTPLIECCLSNLANTVNSNNCKQSEFKKFTEMSGQLTLAQYAFNCEEYDKAQTIIDRLTKLCNDCGCGCGGC